MLVLLLIIPFVFIFLTLKKSNRERRESLIISAVFSGFFVTEITEILNVFSLITYKWLVISWSLLCLGLIIVFKLLPIHTSIRNKNHFSKLPLTEKIWIFFIFVIVVIIGFIALISAPNNGDSMSYHLPRVMHWIQNQSINYYPTDILRQLQFNPWAEYAIMHLQILSGNDSFANLVQYLSLLGSIIGVSLIAQSLGAKTRGQIIAGVFSTTIFMGILQATSTQNDYVASFWLVCFSYFVLVSNKKKVNKIYWFHLVYLGLSLGLALFTKSTSYIYASPFFIWYTIDTYKNNNFLKSTKIILLTIAIAFSINIGFFIRNYTFSGYILDNYNLGSRCYNFSNSKYSVPLIFSNLIKNISLHTNTPIPQLNTLIENQVKYIHALLNININDPNITWSCGKEEETKFKILSLSNHEDTAGNPLHFLLIITSIFIFLKLNISNKKNILLYLLAVGSGIFLISIFVRWMVWNSRLHLPFFVLSAPFIGVILAEKNKNRIFTNISVSFLLLSSIPWILINWSKPLISLPNYIYNIPLSIVNKDIYKMNNNIINTDRYKQYFVSSPAILDDYIQMINLVDKIKCQNIGLIHIIDEYQLWVLLRQKTDTFRIEHVNISNISNIFSKRDSYKSFQPCAIIQRGEKSERELFLGEMKYTLIWNSDQFSLYSR